MPVHGSQFIFVKVVPLNLKPQAPYISRTSSIRITGSDVRMTNQGVGDLPNEDLQAVGCPLLSSPCCGVILGSIHQLRWWWEIPTSTWELSRWAFFCWLTWSPPIWVTSKAPWILRAASGRWHQARGLGWNGMVADWMPNSMLPGVQRLYAHVFTSKGFLKLGIPLITELSLISAGEPTSSLRFLQVENTPR